MAELVVLMNLLLLQHGYPIANIAGDSASRLAYYNALEKSNLEDDYTDFYMLIARQVLASCKNWLDKLNP